MKSRWSKFKSPAIRFLLVGLGVGGGLGWWGGQRAGRQQGGGDSVMLTKAMSRSSGFGDASAEGMANPVAGRPVRGTRGLSKVNEKEFGRSVRAIFRESLPTRRLAMFEKMLDKIGVERFPEVVALIRENDLKGSNSGDEWTRLWTNWGGRDPVGAMTFIDQFDWTDWSGQAQGEAKARVIVNWAQIDPEAAKNFVMGGKELANGDRNHLYWMVEGWTHVDPEATADWLIESGLGLDGEYQSVVDAISRKGGQQALESWFAGLDQTKLAPKDRNGFAEKIVGKKLESEPEKAAAWVEANLNEPWVAESRVVQATADAYARRDPEAALAWANRTGLEAASIVAMGRWCNQDLNAAKQWVSENSGTSESSTTASVVMSFLQQQDPAAATAWARSLPNQALRDRLLTPR